MSNIAIITARGGSKRIPRKNIKEFCGKPIIAYSIEAALQSGVFDEVMVSTDDEEIKEIALKHGAKVPFMRSEATANDYASTYEVLLEVLNEYEKLGKKFERMCCVYPTAPFVTADILKESMLTLETKNAETVMPVVAFSFPPQRGLIIENGQVKFKWEENALKRSQDLEKMYHDCGQFYAVNVKSFLEKKKLIMEKTLPIIMDEVRVQDIDNEDDWKLAEIKFRYLKEKGE